MDLAPYKGGSGPGGYERVYIDHNASRFVSSDGWIRSADTNVKTLDVIFLGIVGNRAYWPRKKKSEVGLIGQSEHGSLGTIRVDLAEDMRTKGPYCTSPDGYTGYPRAHFPWQDYLSQLGGAKGSNFVSPKTLECETCPFTKWSDDTSGYPCQARYYVPFVTDAEAKSPIRVMDFTQSGITALKEHVLPIVSSNHFLFEEVTSIRLKARMNKGREFSVPSFKRGGNSSWDAQNNHFNLPALATAWREAREALTRPPSTGGGSPKLTGLQMGS